MALDGPRVALTPEELSRRFPHTYRCFGRFKEDPGYFQRRRKKEDNPDEIKLRKKLKSRGLPPSYLTPLLRLGLRPRALEARMREIVELRERRDRIRRDTAAAVSSINSSIKQLIGKSKNHECKPSTTADNNAHKSPLADRPDTSVCEVFASLSGVRHSQPGPIQDEGRPDGLSPLLQPSSPDLDRSGVE